jgi:uncharacterized protein HemY
MIRIYLYVLLAISAGLMATLFLAREPGYLLISFGTLTFETSVFALLIALIVFLLALRLALLLLDYLNPLRLLSLGKSWSRGRAQRREKVLPAAVREAEFAALLTTMGSEADGKLLTSGELKKFWKQQTRKLEPTAVSVAVYAALLVDIGNLSEALLVVEKNLDSHWSDELVEQYSLLSLKASDEQVVQQLKKIKGWLQSRPDNVALLLAAGRVSLRNSLWGQAKEYFTACLRVGADTVAFAELARLLLNLKEADHQFLRLQTQAVSKILPPFPQPD